MANVKAEVQGENLVITVPLKEEPVLSASGKTHSVASSHGNTVTDLELHGCKVVIGVNAYIKGYDGKGKKKAS